MESEFNISNSDSNPAITNCKNCSYCNETFTEELWCKNCDPFRVIEEWTSGNSGIDKFIKDEMYEGRKLGKGRIITYSEGVLFPEWVSFDRFENVKQIGEGGFSKVYSATWIDGQSVIYEDKNWVETYPLSKEVALKRLSGSQNMSAEYLNELKTHLKSYLEWDCKNISPNFKIYGITKDPKTGEFLIITEFADYGSLRSILSNDFNNIPWWNKISILSSIALQLEKFHRLGYAHKNFHSGNILQVKGRSCISDFGLSGPANEQKSDGKICGVLPYIAPEVLNGEQYTLPSDIYSFGVIMTEVSSGKPPFYKRKHDANLALEVCNGLRPEFGKGTPEIYKNLAHRCMDANPDQRPTATELYWKLNSIMYHHDSSFQSENFGYKAKEISPAFIEADEEIPNISTSYEKDPNAIYTSRIFTFNNIPKSITGFQYYHMIWSIIFRFYHMIYSAVMKIFY